MSGLAGDGEKSSAAMPSSSAALPIEVSRARRPLIGSDFEF